MTQYFIFEDDGLLRGIRIIPDVIVYERKRDEVRFSPKAGFQPGKTADGQKAVSKMKYIGTGELEKRETIIGVWRAYREKLPTVDHIDEITYGSFVSIPLSPSGVSNDPSSVPSSSVPGSQPSSEPAPSG